MLKKVVVIGPESTGKSTLCQQLADHYNTMWCPEYAREYLLKNGTDYFFDDLLTIAKGQIELEEEYVELIGNRQQGISNTNLPFTIDHSLLFIDTDLYVMKVWCEFVFQKCHRFILDQITERKYDLYLLCNTDLPWTKDELREYPDLASRQQLFYMYKDIMINQAVPWVEIKGHEEGRLQQAIAAVERLLTQ